MASLRSALFLILAAAVASNADCGEPQWHRIDAGPFTFEAPSDVAASPLHGIAVDSLVKEYRGLSLDIMFDYGRYSGSLKGYSDTKSETIGGLIARVGAYEDTPQGDFRFGHFRGAHFAATSEPTMRLTMYISCRDAAACKDAESILRTIRFR
jgi:hypothetical protein